MGYSEIHCHLCGVSFNVARIRTATEPRSFAWNSNGTKHLNFVSAADYSFVNTFCKEDAGCQIAFREDEIPSEADVVRRTYSEVLERFRLLKTQRSPVEARLEKTGLGGEEDMSDDPDYASEESYAMIDDEDGGMDYEFEEPPEECDGMSLEGTMSSEEDSEAQAIYEEWLQYDTKLYPNDFQPASEPCRAQDDQEHRLAVNRMAMIMLSNPDTELMLPLYNQSDFTPGDYLEPEPAADRKRAGSPHNRKFSFINHRLNAGQTSNWYKLADARPWEHIAGPDCTQPKGYSGAKIAFEEMKSICTSQCLYQNQDENDRGQSDQAQAPDFSLSGLCYSMPSRDWAIPEYGGIEIAADNHIWNSIIENEYPPAIPFHPACLEVYKRVCLKQARGVNLTQLASWWRVVNVDYNAFYHIPRDEAVRRSRNQWWECESGDEWLAANPCLIPEFKQIVEAAVAEETAMMHEGNREFSIVQHATNCHASNAFVNLPADIHKIILDMLPTVDLANLSLGVPDLKSLIEPIIRSSLLLEYPYLWEFWCDLEYPIEVGMSGIEHRLYTEAAAPRNEEAQRIVEVLREDGFDDMANEVEEHHKQAEDELRTDFLDSVLVNAVPYLEGKNVDYVHLALALHVGLKNGRLKGLRNRARIWKDCNWILKDIDRLEEEGKILHDGKISPDTWRELQAQSV